MSVEEMAELIGKWVEKEATTRAKKFVLEKGILYANLLSLEDIEKIPGFESVESYKKIDGENADPTIPCEWGRIKIGKNYLTVKLVMEVV